MGCIASEDEAAAGVFVVVIDVFAAVEALLLLIIFIYKNLGCDLLVFDRLLTYTKCYMFIIICHNHMQNFNFVIIVSTCFECFVLLEGMLVIYCQL
jgi:hypothetical protein